MLKRAGLRAAIGFLTFIAALEGVAAADCPESAVRWASSSNRLYISGPVTCSLTDLDPIVSHAVLERTNKANKIWMLRANVLLQNGAALVVTGEEASVLRLRSDATVAVFILADWGHIEFDGVQVMGWDEAADTQDQSPEINGRAYILARSRLDAAGVARESSMKIRNGFVGFLGHGEKSDTYGLAWKVVGTPGDGLRIRGELIETFLQQNHVGAYVAGGGGMNFTGNLILQSADAGLRFKDTVETTIVDNDINDNGKNGINCTEGCADLFFQNNRISGNVGSGIVLRRCDGPSILESNELRSNVEAGLALIHCDGNTARFNDFVQNKRGVRLSSGASDNLFELNDIEGNFHGIYSYIGETPPSGDGRPRGNVFLRNDLFSNEQAVYSNRADEAEYVRNIIGEYDYLFDGALLFQDSLGTVLAGNIIPIDALVHTRGSSGGGPNSTTFITQAGFFAQAIAPILIETSGQALTTFVETQDITHTQDGSVLRTFATPTENRAPLPGISRTIYRSFPYFARPASGEVEIFPGTANRWNVTNWFAPVSVTYTVAQLVPSTAYRVKRNGEVIQTVTSSASGVVTFSDVAPTQVLGQPNTRYEVLQ